MPKRARPFPETYSSQYKIHIGQQEISHLGVFGNQYRQEIYEKTKNLLFSGAKVVMGKFLSGEEKIAESRSNERTEPTTCSQALLKGQRLIGQDGRLTRVTPQRGVDMGPEGCCVCHKSQGPRTVCSQCERSACPSCTRQCSSCCSSCCSICTVVDYSGPYDELLCCGCST